jgi:hypothetical protein
MPKNNKVNALIKMYSLRDTGHISSPLKIVKIDLIILLAHYTMIHNAYTACQSMREMFLIPSNRGGEHENI